MAYFTDTPTRTVFTGIPRCIITGRNRAGGWTSCSAASHRRTANLIRTFADTICRMRHGATADNTRCTCSCSVAQTGFVITRCCCRSISILGCSVLIGASRHTICRNKIMAGIRHTLTVVCANFPCSTGYLFFIGTTVCVSRR